MSTLCEWTLFLRLPTICQRAANPLCSVAYALAEIQQRGVIEEQLSHFPLTSFILCENAE